jgi:hypothetical protein
MFGEVSVEVESKLAAGEVIVRVEGPPRSPKHMSLRAALPAGWKVVGADTNGAALRVRDGEVVDLVPRQGEIKVRFTVEKAQRPSS